jgi:hypothetical protein
MGHFVAYDPLQLVAVQLFQQAGGDGDGCLVGVASGGEGIHRRVVDDVDIRDSG